jgi:hypothetical protein
MKIILKYYLNKIPTRNHIFKKEEDETALCGMSGFDTSWGTDPEELKRRSTCGNCYSLRSGDHPFLPQKEWDNW